MSVVINKKKYIWSFIVADMALPILGADFLSTNKLVVDMAAKRLSPLRQINSEPFVYVDDLLIFSSTLHEHA